MPNDGHGESTSIRACGIKCIGSRIDYIARENISEREDERANERGISTRPRDGPGE